MKHWFSESTIKLIHKKKALYREYKRSGDLVTLNKYKRLSNLVCSKCRQDTIAHSNLVCQHSHSNPGDGLIRLKVIVILSLHFTIPVLQLQRIAIKRLYLTNIFVLFSRRRIFQTLIH